MNWILRRPQQQYSVERLNELYSDLLIFVQIDKEALGRRWRRRAPIESPPGERILWSSRPLPRQESLGVYKFTAFRVLSATPAADKEGSDGGSIALRDKTAVASMVSARNTEEQLVKLIQSIGEVVAYGDKPGTSLRCDAVFEYFCEKQILALLVHIAKARPDTSSLHPVTWSPLVKSQVLRTLSILISNAQDGPSLYYLLSNNYVNELIRNMLPLRQWTDVALEIMLPEYVSLLKCISLQLAASPNALFHFLTIQQEFPVFTSAIKVATSTLSDPFARLTATSIIVTLMSVKSHHIRNWITGAEVEQKTISAYICERLLENYFRVVKLTIGPVVDAIRATRIASHLTELQKNISEVNEILCCGVRSLNVRLCESLLQRVVAVLLENMSPKIERQFLVVGVLDLDVIPEVEAMAQTAIFFLSQFVISFKYPPLIRMLAVALFHPLSTKIWQKPIIPTDEYILTTALNTIVQVKNVAGDDSDLIANPFRRSLLSSFLSGKMGEWMFVPASMLIEGIMLSDAIDLDTLFSLDLVPKFGKTGNIEYASSELEEALLHFLCRDHKNESSLSILVLERVGSLSLSVLSQAVNSMSEGGKDIQRLTSLLPLSPLVHSLRAIHGYFCVSALEAEQKTGVSELFLDLTQLATTSRYAKLSADHQLKYGCLLESFSCHEYRLHSEVLVRKHRCVGSNDVEDCRYSIRLALHFRALCKCIDNLIEEANISSKNKQNILRFPFFDLVDFADDLLLTIGDIKDKPNEGTDIDLRGRMTFKFHAASNWFEQSVPKNHEQRKKDLVIFPSSHLILVLDPTDMYIVKPASRRECNFGTILCSASLQSIIAFASDAEWLHIAVRRMEDVGFLIRNGNMALRFESVGTCLIVRQFLERSQAGLRYELKNKVYGLFMASAPRSSVEGASQAFIAPVDESVISDISLKV